MIPSPAPATPGTHVDCVDAVDVIDRGGFAPDLPILDEVPLLGAAIRLARGIDRSVAQLLDALIELQDHDVAEHATGVALEQWLAIAGRRTAADRRMLLTACDVLRRLPSLRLAFCSEGTVSWAQTRSVVLAVRPLPRVLDDTIDGELARTIDACRDSDPDALIHAVSRAARSLDPAETRKVQEVAEREEFVALQPRLDGSGGKLFGDLGALSFATVDAALSPSTEGQPEEAAAAGAHDGAGDRGASDGGGDGGASDGAGGASDGAGDGGASDGAGNGGRLRPGRRRAQRLVDLCDASLSGGTNHRGTSRRAGSRPQLIVRVDLDTLLDRDCTPAELLTTVAGGKLWIDAASARRLVQERGADLRSVVLDDRGRVVGVGRQGRIAPDWLADATLALHDTCSFPGCHVAARRCETDHAQPWHPTAPDQVPGSTDIEQLAPLCRKHNAGKEPDGWRATGDADGSRRWEHPRSGLATTTRPATWRAAVLARSREEDGHRHGAGPGRHPPWREAAPQRPDLAGERGGTYDIEPRAGPRRASEPTRARRRGRQRPHNARAPARRSGTPCLGMLGPNVLPRRGGPVRPTPSSTSGLLRHGRLEPVVPHL